MTSAKPPVTGPGPGEDGDGRGNVKATVAPRIVEGDTATEHVRVREPVTVVIFGASGDLSRRKLVPALYHLQSEGFVSPQVHVVGFSRSEMTDDTFRDLMLSSLREHVGPTVTADAPLLRSLFYVPGSNDDPAAFARLRARIEELERDRGFPGNRLYYLSVAPEFFPTILKQLGAAGLIHEAGTRAGPGVPWSRVIIEKPFGRDLASARELNRLTTSVLDESQIYRIDHYLGKETVQNILSFRFGNAIFESLWNQKHIDNVQITVGETLGMEGRRGAYYDTAGALRDMVQNHILQLLSLVAMEPPSALEATCIRDEKVKVLRALAPLSRRQVAEFTVRGQYGVGTDAAGALVKGYRQEEGVRPDSTTETFVALRLHLENWRWAGVPFYLRSGKRLAKRVSEVAIQFKQPPLQLFRAVADSADGADGADAAGGAQPVPQSNVLVIRIQPDEGISMSFACKVPGMKIQLATVDMDFYYKSAFAQRSPEAYERLLLDALRGDASLFTRSDEVELAWRFISSIHEGWAQLPAPVFPNYYPFTDGPDEARRLLDDKDDGLRERWRKLSEM